MVNSISNIPPAQNSQHVIAQAQPLQNKEAINDRTAIVQTKNEKKVKEEKEKKNFSSKRSKQQDSQEDTEEIKTEAMDHASVNFSNILVAQEMEQQKKVVTHAKAANAYKLFDE